MDDSPAVYVLLAVLVYIGGVLLGIGIGGVIAENDTEKHFKGTCHTMADTRAQDKFCDRLATLANR
ncbi:hypothetical protein [Streptomyces malaysiensis]